MRILTLILIIALAILAPPVFAQLSDLDLLEDDDRSFGFSINRSPDPMAETDTETQSAILLLPISIPTASVSFQGGAGAYWTRSIANAHVSSALQWRVQGGPQYKWIGLQFYVEGFWKESIGYAGFVRLGEFDLGHVIVSGGLGTLVEAETETELTAGIERNASTASDAVVKGLILASAEVDTNIFESLRLLGSVQPGTAHIDYIGEAQVTYAAGKVNLTGLIRVGIENGELTRRWTGLAQVPF